MTQDREQQFKQLVAEFPDSPMGHFSLGKLYLDTKRYEQAAASLEEAVRLDPSYAAALVALGEAYVALGDNFQAKHALDRAHKMAVTQDHPGLAEEIAKRLTHL